MTERPGASTSTDLDETEHGVPGGEPPVPPQSAVPEAPDPVGTDDADLAEPDGADSDEADSDEAGPDEAGRGEVAQGATPAPDDDAPSARVVEPPTTPAPLPVVPAPVPPPDDPTDGDAPAGDTAEGDPTEDEAAAPPPAPARGLAPAPAAGPATEPGAAGAHRHLARAEEAEERRRRRRRALRRTGLGAVVVLLVVATTASVWLYRTSEAWEDRAARYEGTAEELGADLAAARTTLAGTEAELDAVRGQLETAKARIIELADEKQQATDDREAQRQLAAYQDRVNDAAGRVALALDQCVQGQQELIGYLQAQATAAEADDPPPYDAAELEQFRTDVETLCQTASEANIALQRELDR